MSMSIGTASRLLGRTRQVLLSRSFAGKAPAGEAAQAQAQGVVPVNYMVDGQDPPLRPIEEYPDWLSTITLPTLTEISKKDEEDLTLPELRRYFQLTNRVQIKENALTKDF